MAPPTERSFRDIAEAGGGSYDSILADAPAGAGGAEKIIGHILASSFGEEWKASALEFARIYLEYRRAGFFQ